jgi:erythromycin esterase-like protein
MNAERYYRAMFHGRDESWNLRDTHMFETLNELSAHLDSGRAKVVVWAHNSHLGNARATEMSERGELNVGQLVRERFGEKALLIGFSTYSGTVTAARDWGDPAERHRVRLGAFPRDGNSAFLAESARAKRRDKTVAPAAPATRDRSNLPPRDQTLEPLFPRAIAGAIRYNHSSG